VSDSTPRSALLNGVKGCMPLVHLQPISQYPLLLTWLAPVQYFFQGLSVVETGKVPELQKGDTSRDNGWLMLCTAVEGQNNPWKGCQKIVIQVIRALFRWCFGATYHNRVIINAPSHNCRRILNSVVDEIRMVLQCAPPSYELVYKSHEYYSCKML
jgi:hypothetical protein